MNQKPNIVIKLGGSALQSADTLQQLAVLIRGYQKRRYNVVLVHGGGPAINQELQKQNITWKFINGQRQTTAEMMDVIESVLAGTVNKMLVDSLIENNIQAIGLSGIKDKILFCSKASAELQQVGQVEFVDTSAIEYYLSRFGLRVPVIAPVGIGLDGQKYNINADWAATQIAIALNAKKMIFLTDQQGILNENKQLVGKANAVMMQQMIKIGTIHGGMLTKVNAMIMALESGIKTVQVLHASYAGFLLEQAHIGTSLTEVRRHAQNRSAEVMHGKAG